MEVKYQFIGSNIIKNGDFIFSVPYIINKIVVFNDEIVVLKKVGNIGGNHVVLDNNNVYAYDFSGNLIWQIEENDFKREECYYTDIYKVNDELCLYNVTGYEVIVENKTGKIKSIELIK